MYHHYNFCIILLCSHLIQTHRISSKHDVVYECLFMCQSYFHFLFLNCFVSFDFIIFFHSRVQHY
jgi:hypothetical protein